ncbi:MAG: hypothetical protein HY563_09925, partial [Ignavibacteriales bacterium]|nr:hypothetical protein [Ignavibacteriales bacterium]
VFPGNEYRVFDIRNVDQYPQDRPARLRGGADVSRFLAKPLPDNEGGSAIIRDSKYAEYLDVEFELLWDSETDSVYIAGDFNGWNPLLGGPLKRNGNRYTWQTSLRRGRYDYQYVVGNDWILLEGNDWRTVNRYTALVYYRDPRFGGFDRIMGSLVRLSPGGTEVSEQW